MAVPTYSVGPKPLRGDIRRKAGRVVCQDITCSLGDVLDLSASGMRVITRQSPPPTDQEVLLRLETLAGPICVPVKTIWVKKAGWGRREIGLTFGNMDTKSRHALAVIARASAHNEHLRGARLGD